MTQYYTQLSRPYDFVPASGSSLQIGRYGPTGTIVDLTTLDIETCHILETFKMANTTHSGCNGCEDWTVTGSAWEFSAKLSFPKNISDQVGELQEAFLEPLLGSMRSFAVRFNIGAPEMWTQSGLKARSLRATRCLLTTVVHDLDANSGLAVAKIEVAGRGKSLLWTYLDEVAKYPQIWLV